MKKYLLVLSVLVLALALVACGGEATDTTIDQGTEPAVEHVHAYADEIIPATCTATGKIVSKCECGDIQSETEIPLADHIASALDCEKDTVCTVCNAVLAEKTGHIFGASEIVTAATCSAAGKEKGACAVCGKIVETEIPATGHVAGNSITFENGNFKTTCTICSQAVTLKTDAPAFSVDFEGDIATQSANSIGLSINKPEEWKIAEVNGSNSFTVDDGKSFYINIVEPKKLAALGTFVISFDYTATKEAKEGHMGSIFSLLDNCQDGKQTSAGSLQYGWIVKYVEDRDVLATVNTLDKLTDANSVAAAKNTKYNVQIVISPTSTATHVFVNGKYIGTSGQAHAISTLKDANAAFRIGDGPVHGHTIDNLTISALK